LTFYGQGTPPNSPKFQGIRPTLSLTDIQGILGDVSVAVEDWFLGFLGLVEAKLNSFQIELLGSMN